MHPMSRRDFVVSTALGLVWPKVVQLVIDLGLRDAGFLDLLILGLIVVLLVRAVIDGARQFVMAYTGERVIFDLRMAIVRHLQSLSLSFFNRRKTGELMSHVTSDATLVHGVITQTIIQVLGQVLTLVGGVVVIFLMNWRLALLTLVVAPPIGILGQRMGRRIRDISREAQDAQGEAVGVLQEAIAEVRVVQAFTREEYEAARFHDKLLFTFNKTIERARIAATMFPILRELVERIASFKGEIADVRKKIDPGGDIADNDEACVIRGIEAAGLLADAGTSNE